MATTTFTTTPAEDTRLQAWANSLQQPSVKAAIIALMQQTLKSYESQQNGQAFTSGYTPINPT